MKLTSKSVYCFKNRLFLSGLILAVAGMLTMTNSAMAQISRSVGLLKGDVVSNDGQPLGDIDITIMKGNERISKTKSGPEGKFQAILQPNATYRVTFSSSNYGYQEDTVVVPALAKYQEFPVHATLWAIHEGQSFPIATQVFLPNSSVINGAAMNDLQNVVNLMRHNPKLTVNVTVYPDAPIKNAKKDVAQQKLVEARSTTVRSFFLGQGISVKNFNVTTSTMVPAGQFASSAKAVASEPAGKKKKKAAVAASSGLVPQYIEIVAHIVS